MIVVECFLDTFVVKKFGFGKNERKHADGKGNVLNYLNKYSHMNIGIIDQDPGKTQPSRLNNYQISDNLLNSHGLQLLTKIGGSTKIIVVKDDMEHWIYSRAERQNISPQSYGLPNTAHDLHSKPRIELTKRFKDFYDDLLQTNDPGLLKLREWISD